MKVVAQSEGGAIGFMLILKKPLEWFYFKGFF